MGLGLLLIGGLVLLVSAIGCVGAHSEKVLLLMAVSRTPARPAAASRHDAAASSSQYLGLLVVLVLGQLFVALLLVINRDKVSKDASVQKRRRPQRLFPCPVRLHAA